MKKFTFLVLVPFFYSFSFSQSIDCQWADYSNYGGLSQSLFQNVTGTYDNYAIGVGSFEHIDLQGHSYSTGSSGNYDNGFVAKYDSVGNFVWLHDVICSKSSFVSCSDVDSDNNIYVAGGFDDTISYNGFTLATNKAAFHFDAFIFKLDSAGSVLWSKKIAGTDSSTVSPHKILLDGDGDLIVYLTNGDNYNAPVLIEGQSYTGSIILIKYDQAGNLLWVKSFLDLHSDNAGFAKDDHITVDRNNNIYFAGGIWDTAIFNGVSFYPDIVTQIDTILHDTFEYVIGNSFVASLTADGQERWMYTVKNEGGVHSPSIVSDKGSNLFVTGYYNGVSSPLDTVYFSSTDYLIGGENYLLKLDTTGQVLGYRNIPSQTPNSLVYGNNKLYIGGNYRYYDQVYIDTYANDLSSLDSISFGGSNYDYCYTTALTKSGTSMLIGGLINDQTNVGSCVLDGFNTCNRAFIVQLSSDLITRVQTVTEVAQNLSIFPNPTNQNLSIVVNNHAVSSVYQISDLQGRLVMQGRLEGTQTMISVSNLSKGLYIIQVGQERSSLVIE